MQMLILLVMFQDHNRAFFEKVHEFTGHLRFSCVIDHIPRTLPGWAS